MVLLGIASNMIFVMYLPELVHLCLEKINKKNDPVLNDKASGMFGAFFSLGFFTAPLISGYLMDLRDFEFSCNIMALVDMFLVVLFIIVFVIGKAICNKCVRNEEPK